MKHLKSYKLFENNLELKNKLAEYGIENYTINSDGSIDVNGDVDLSDKNLTKIPFKFNKVSGDFYCHNNQLKSLYGCPIEVGGYFGCDNNKLTSLEYCPVEIGGDFNCFDNLLTSLEGAPAEIGGDFNCIDNKLTELDCASNIKGDIYCSGNIVDPNNNGFYGHCEGKII